MSRRYFFDGFGEQTTFMCPERAAQFANDNGISPFQLRMLEGGKTHEPEPWEIDEVIAHMRDQAPPL